MTSKIFTNRLAVYLLVIAILGHFLLLINTLFTLWPEMVTYPYLINNGFLLYRDIINPYPPTFNIFLAAFSKYFGYFPQPYQIFTWIFIIFIDLSVIFIATKITNRFIFGVLSGLFFALLSVPFEINGLWYDLIQTPFILFAVFYLHQYFSQKKYKNLFLTFLLVTIAASIKQQALWLFAWFLAVSTFNRDINFRFSIGNFLPLVLPGTLVLISFAVFFYFRGTLSEFTYWTIQFPLVEASKVPGYLQLPTLRQLMVVLALYLTFLPIFISKNKKQKFIAFTSLFLVVFSYPRFGYFHLGPALAVISLTVGPLMSQFFKSEIKLRLLTVAGFLLLTMFSLRYYFNNWSSDVRFFEPEVLTAARFLSLVTSSSDRLYIQNGPDQLLPLSGRLPVKPWADEFPWYLEIKNINNEIIKGVNKEDPKYVVRQPYLEGEKYGLGSYRPQKIADYIDNNYEDYLQINQSLWLKTKR